jgi:hypothetical protein
VTVDRAHRDAAELAAELRRDRGYGEEAARIVIALVSALKAAEKERDGLQAWYDKVAPTTVPTVREAVAEKRAKARRDDQPQNDERTALRTRHQTRQQPLDRRLTFATRR